MGSRRLRRSAQPIEEKRRLRAALAVIEYWDAEVLGLVGEIAGDTGAGEDDDAYGHDVEHAVVAFEGSGLAACVSPGPPSRAHSMH